MFLKLKVRCPNKNLRKIHYRFKIYCIAKWQFKNKEQRKDVLIPPFDSSSAIAELRILRFPEDGTNNQPAETEHQSNDNIYRNQKRRINSPNLSLPIHWY